MYLLDNIILIIAEVYRFLAVRKLILFSFHNQCSSTLLFYSYHSKVTLYTDHLFLSIMSMNAIDLLCCLGCEKMIFLCHFLDINKLFKFKYFHLLILACLFDGFLDLQNSFYSNWKEFIPVVHIEGPNLQSLLF